MTHRSGGYCHVTRLEKRVDEHELARARVTMLAVRGMGCPTCATRVRNALLRHAGVLHVEVALQDAAATVAFDPARAAIPDLLQAVARAGTESGHRYSASVLGGP